MLLKNLLLPVLALLTFSGVNAQDEKAQYGNNIISFSPLMLCSPGAGFGISYERNLDKKGIAALYLPMSVSITNSGDRYYNTYPNKKFLTGFFMPGLKFYPTGGKGKIKYAVAPSIGILLGEVPSNGIYDPLAHSYVYTMKTRFSLGTMVFNSVNINPTEHLHMGIEMGIGIAYIDQHNGVSTNRTPALFQLGLKIGYRF